MTTSVLGFFQALDRKNNIAAHPKKISYFASHLIFHAGPLAFTFNFKVYYHFHYTLFPVSVFQAALNWILRREVCFSCAGLLGL